MTFFKERKQTEVIRGFRVAADAACPERSRRVRSFPKQYEWCEGRRPRLRNLSLSKLPIPFQHMPLRHYAFQLAEISAAHDWHDRPPVHISQSSFQRMIWMQKWHRR